MKRFVVLIPKDDSGVEFYPMKEWLRQHLDRVPGGLNPTSHSHQLRDGLKRLGWSVHETESQVCLVPPDAAYCESTIQSVLGDEDEDRRSEKAESSFALEYQLRDFIAQNIGVISVHGKRLHLYVDETGRDGVEFPTAVGPINILANDDSGAFYVFELKRARSPDHAVGQLSRYMGWVKHTIGKNRDVHGVIVAKSVPESLRYALSIIPNLSLFEYEVSFKLSPAHGSPSAARSGLGGGSSLVEPEEI
jgi:hypothetical protein